MLFTIRYVIYNTMPTAEIRPADWWAGPMAVKQSIQTMGVHETQMPISTTSLIFLRCTCGWSQPTQRQSKREGRAACPHFGLRATHVLTPRGEPQSLLLAARAWPLLDRQCARLESRSDTVRATRRAGVMKCRPCQI